MQGIKDILDGLKRIKTTVYLACDEKPADDFAKTANDAVHAITTLRARVKELESGGWISVDTALPCEMICVITTNGSHVRPAYRTGNARWSAWGDNEVTHWQPLPNPPKD